MKLSKFNILNDIDKTISNTVTGAILQASEEEYQNICNQEFSLLGKETIELLYDNGIIVEDDLTEVNLLRIAYNEYKLNNNTCKITIAPSLCCNFNCVYCYEKKDSYKMSHKTQEKTIEFIKEHLLTNRIKSLSLCWYGGEPTLQLEIIQYLAKKLIDFCSINDIEYSSTMISNGYLLDNDKIHLIKKLKISTIQISIDGSEKTHNERRFLINGNRTFKTILNNVRLLASNEIYVLVRVNLDYSNINDFIKVYELFRENNYITCYPALVTEEDTQTDIQRNLCIKNNDFQLFYNKIISTLSKDDIYKCFSEFKPRICSCAAEHKYSYLIDPKGYLYKCLNDIGNMECAVGSVFDHNKNARVIAKYLGRDPFTEDECKTCPYLPMCYGGCVFEYTKKNKHTCNFTKYIY